MFATSILYIILPLTQGAILNSAAIDQLVEAVRACRQVPAISLAVVQLDDQDKIIQQFVKGYGYQRPSCQSVWCPGADADTKFCIGSTTKAFTGAILGTLLANDPRFNATLWDTRIKMLVPSPQANFFGDHPASNMVTVRDILSHRSGISQDSFAIFFLKQKRTRSEILSNVYTLNAAGPVETVFRSSFLYNNWLIAFAGYISELLGRKSWEDLVRDYFFKPLSMTNSEFYHIDYSNGQGFARTGKRSSTGAWDEVTPAGFAERTTASAPAGMICSSATDMGKYIAFLLKTNASDADRIPRSILQDAMNPSASLMGMLGGWYMPKDPIGGELFTSGFGWFQGMYRGYKRVEHSGGVDGFTTNIILLPDIKAGIFVSSTNDVLSEREFAGLISYFIADLILGERPWLNTTNICTEYPEKFMPEKMPDPPGGSLRCFLNPDKYQKYSGAYDHPMFGPVDILWDDSKSELQLVNQEFGNAVLCGWPDVAPDDNILWLMFPGYFDYLNPPKTFLANITVQFVDDTAGRAKSLLLIAINPSTPPEFRKRGYNLSNASANPQNCVHTFSAGCLFVLFLLHKQIS